MLSLEYFWRVITLKVYTCYEIRIKNSEEQKYTKCQSMRDCATVTDLPMALLFIR